MLDHAVDGDRRNLGINLVPERPSFVPKHDAAFPNGLVLRTSRKDLYLLYAHRLARLQDGYMPEPQQLQGMSDQRVGRAADLAIPREAVQRGQIKVIWMPMGNDNDVNWRKSIEIDFSLGTRDHQPILERVLEDRVHEDLHRPHFY